MRVDLRLQTSLVHMSVPAYIRRTEVCLLSAVHVAWLLAGTALAGEIVPEEPDIAIPLLKESVGLSATQAQELDEHTRRREFERRCFAVHEVEQSIAWLTVEEAPHPSTEYSGDYYVYIANRMTYRGRLVRTPTGVDLVSLDCSRFDYLRGRSRANRNSDCSLHRSARIVEANNAALIEELGLELDTTCKREPLWDEDLPACPTQRKAGLVRFLRTLEPSPTMPQVSHQDEYPNGAACRLSDR